MCATLERQIDDPQFPPRNLNHPESRTIFQNIHKIPENS